MRFLSTTGPSTGFNDRFAMAISTLSSIVPTSRMRNSGSESSSRVIRAAPSYSTHANHQIRSAMTATTSHGNCDERRGHAAGSPHFRLVRRTLGPSRPATHELPDQWIAGKQHGNGYAGGRQRPLDENQRIALRSQQRLPQGTLRQWPEHDGEHRRRDRIVQLAQQVAGPRRTGTSTTRRASSGLARSHRRCTERKSPGPGS